MSAPKNRFLRNLNYISENGRMFLREERERLQMLERELFIREHSFPTEPSKDGYYHLMVPDHRVKSGRKHLKSKSLEELQEKAYWHAKGISGYAKKTFLEVFKITQDEQLKYVKAEEKRASVKNTVCRHWQDYNRFFAGTDFELMYISEITKSDIENIVLANLTKYNLRKRALTNMLSLLRTAFTKAYQEEWIEKNTFDLVNVKDPRFTNMLIEPVDLEKRIYSEYEFRVIKKAVQERHAEEPKYMPAYALELQMLLGLRRGEVCALKFSDIQKDDRAGVLCLVVQRELLTVKKSPVNPKEYMKIVEHTKTKMIRKIPIYDELQHLLLKIIAVHKQYGLNSEFIFPGETKPGCISIGAVYRFYRHICRSRGITIRADVIRGPHAFRRNAAERISNSGGSAEMAAKLLGNSPAVLKSNYYDGMNLAEAKEILNSANKRKPEKEIDSSEDDLQLLVM